MFIELERFRRRQARLRDSPFAVDIQPMTGDWQQRLRRNITRIARNIARQSKGFFAGTSGFSASGKSGG